MYMIFIIIGWGSFDNKAKILGTIFIEADVTGVLSKNVCQTISFRCKKINNSRSLWISFIGSLLFYIVIFHIIKSWSISFYSKFVQHQQKLDNKNHHHFPALFFPFFSWKLNWNLIYLISKNKKMIIIKKDRH